MTAIVDKSKRKECINCTKLNGYCPEPQCNHWLSLIPRIWHEPDPKYFGMEKKHIDPEPQQMKLAF